MRKPFQGKFGELETDGPETGVQRKAVQVGGSWFGRLMFSAKAKVGFHSHKADELLLVEKGRMLVSLRQGKSVTEYILCPGEYIIIPGGTRHALSALAKRKALVLMVHAPESVARRPGRMI